MANNTKPAQSLPVTVRTPVLKFATVRSPTGVSTTDPILEIQPATALSQSVVSALQSAGDQSTRIQAVNQLLQPELQSSRFFKAKADVASALTNNPGASSVARGVSGTDSSGTGSQDQAGLQQLLETLYDNILIRTVTKSTRSEVFKSLTDQIKTVYQQLNADKISVDRIKNLRILLPEGLVFAFSPPKVTPPVTVSSDPGPLFTQIKGLNDQKAKLKDTKGANFSAISAEQDRIRQQSAAAVAAQVSATPLSSATAAPIAAGGAETQSRVRVATDVAPPPPTTSPLLGQLQSEAAQLQQTESQLDAQIGGLSQQVIQFIPKTQLTQIGTSFVDLQTVTFTPPPPPSGGEIIVHSDGCALKFPFQIADLRVVEQQAVAYVPGEIAHINNTQQGELLERNTRRLTRTETTESITTEQESTQETDTQSTEKFSLEKAASDIQSEQSSIDVNASVSADYGAVKAEVDAGYSTSQSSQNSNSSSQSYAKETMQKTVDRVSSKVTQQRSTTTIDEFEERVKHVVDGTKVDGPKSYVYRWLTKLVRGTLKNYGKRLMFQIDIPYPLQYYFARTKQQTPTLDLPPDPRTYSIWGNRVFPNGITPDSYLDAAALYRTKLDAPPPKNILLSSAYSGDGKVQTHPITIPSGYRALTASLVYDCWPDIKLGQVGQVDVLIGNRLLNNWPITIYACNLNHETDSLPLSVIAENSFMLNVEVTCEQTDETNALKAWQLKCYQALIDAYDALKAEAEGQTSGFNPNAPGLNPDDKQSLIVTELKKGALSKMFRCNPFWVTDNYLVGNEYDPDCCADSINAEKIRFLETLFDWRNMTYELYPYFYGSKQNWATLSSLTDDDPRFQAALQASYATVRVPVFRDSLKETAAINFITNNSIANYETVPPEMKAIVDELNDVAPSKFTVGLDGTNLDTPVEIVDLGLFPVPTDLVILERGVADGIKPIGFPFIDEDPTDLRIPKQYSPAIIDDSSEPPSSSTGH
jgi:hypothetical protein